MVPGGWILFFLVNFLWKATQSLRITDLYVPRSPRGTTDEAPMNCKYDLEGEALYDVKWYKDDMQFFRCMADGSVHEYPVEGVKLRYSAYVSSGSCPFTLIGLTSGSGGTYKCEVTLESPNFTTVAEKKDFTVVKSSRRTQELNDVSTEKIRSSNRNQTARTPSSNGVMQSKPIIYVYSVIVVLLFCRF